MTSVLFTYRVDQEEELYHAKLITDMTLHAKGRFLSDYVYSIVSYGLGKYREKQGMPAMTTGVRLGTLYPSQMSLDAVTLTQEDRINYDFCFMTKDNKSTYYIDGSCL